MRLAKHILGLARRLLGDRRGNVAMILALCALPLALTVGFSVDLMRQQTVKQDTQDSVDHSALAAAISRAKTEAEMKRIVEDYLKANLDSRYLQDSYTFDVDYEPETKHITVNLKGEITAFFAGLIGRDTMPVNVTATAIRGTADAIEVALVLDNTWSMSDSAGNGQTRITALKSASKILVNELMVNPDAPVRIGVVPYADFVNVGMSNRNQPWLSVLADYTVTGATPPPKTCEKKPVTRNVCTGAVNVPATCSTTNDGVTTYYACTKKDTTNEKCTPVTKIEDVCTGGGSAPVTNYRWYGCVNSRNTGSLRLNDTLPAVRFTGIMATSQTCLNPILPLTNDKSTVISTINNLVINIGGYKPETHIPSGMIWGVNVLSPSAPFTEGGTYHPANRDPRKILVLMTDGDNTRRYRASDGWHVGASNAGKYASEMAQTNKDVSDICAYAKSKNMEVYTVGLNVPTSTGRAMLQACATSDDHAFSANDSASLEEAFRDIALSINRVRLVR